MRLYFEYVTRMKDGKKFRIPYCYSFGYAMSVSLNEGVLVQQDEFGYFVDYDPRCAEIKLNKGGYLVLHIGNHNYRSSEN